MTKVNCSVFLFLYLLSLPTQQDCVLPVVRRFWKYKGLSYGDMSCFVQEEELRFN